MNQPKCQHCKQPMDLIFENDKVALYKCQYQFCVAKGNGKSIRKESND
jgi:hypothetical protein